ncbi:MAG TPA: class I SAM-dependent methyltransferase [Planctomycetota bacterium]|nr:class I SAM-dependent methyltransferase [Planctomycetota bacterium]
MTLPPSASDPTGSRIEGYLDVAGNGKVSGWVWDPAAPDQPVRIDLYVGERRRLTLVADHFRRDLVAAGKGDGRHGFAYTLPEPPRPGQPLRVLVTGTDVELFGPPDEWPGEIPMPPLEMIRTVGLQSEQELVENGRGTLHVCRRFGQLRPDGHVLDVGCGIGRLAIPLTRFLGPSGSYDGLDVIREMIEWSNAHIAPGRDQFRFHHLDVHNAFYNPGGTTRASEYRFPFPDASFTLAFLGSVFTHLLPPELERYLSEIARVLQPGGRCLISYFVLENGALKRPEGKSSLLDFQREGAGYRTAFEVPEQGVAYEESYIRGLYTRFGLSICEPIRWGPQDLVVATRLESPPPARGS